MVTLAARTFNAAYQQIMASDDNTHSIDDARRARFTEALLRTGQGDRSAFETLYRATSAKLFGVCLRIFPERHEAEEALQDAYITIWNRAASFQPGRASPISWLVAVTRNRAIDRLRASGKAKYMPIDEANEIADTAPRADAQMFAASEDDQLHGCIRGLKSAMRISSVPRFWVARPICIWPMPKVRRLQR